MNKLATHHAQQPLSYARVNLGAIAHNFKQVQALARTSTSTEIETVTIIPVIKSDAYGHGLIEVATVLNECQAHWFAVSNPMEAVALRTHGFKQHILLLESVLPQQAPMIVEHQLIPTLCSLEFAQALNQVAQDCQTTVHVHIKADTGMSRFGIAIEDVLDFVWQVKKLDHIVIDGVYTHFPMADSDSEFTQTQMHMMVDLMRKLNVEGVHIPYVHAANSMGILGYRNYAFNLCRIGIMLYGHYPRHDFEGKLDLKRAMSVHSQIVFIKDVKEGEGISYGFSYIAKQDMVIAVLPIGYADGYFRHMSNKAHVLVDGVRCPVVGRVTMDQIMIDISAIKNPHVGMEVVVMGKQGDNEITADELATWAETISYEITCSLGSRLEHFYN